MSTKEELQHYWVLYSMQGETKSFERCIDIFLELYSKYLQDHSRSDGDEHSDTGSSKGSGDSDIVGGPHFSNLPDGLLAAVARSLHRCLDIFVNKPIIVGTDIVFATKLIKALIIISRNVDNLGQLSSSSSVGDSLAIANTFLLDEFAAKIQTLRTEAKEYVATALYLLQCLHDPYGLWYKLIRRKTLNAETVIVHPPSVHLNATTLMLSCLEQEAPLVHQNLLASALNALGSILVGSKPNGVKISSESIVESLFLLLRRKTLPLQQRLEVNELVLRCIAVMVHTLHEADPDSRQVEVPSLFSYYLLTLRSLPVHDDESVQTKVAMLSCIRDILSYFDRSALQVIFIGVGIFEQLIQITQQGADVVDIKGGMLQAVSSIKVLGAILRGSGKCKELFLERIGYRMLLDVLMTIRDPSSEFVDALIELVVESSEKDLSYLIVANPQAAVMLLDYAAVLRSPDFQLMIINRIAELLEKRMHSRIQCASFGMLDAILHLFRSTAHLRTDVADSLVRLFEILASHSIEPGELKELFLLLKKDDNGYQPGYILRLMHSMSVIAYNTSSKNPFRYFDIQGDHDGIVVPSMRKKWPGPGFTFHAWVCLDDSPLTSTVSADSAFIRRILYSVMNNSGGGFEAFFTYDCILVVAVSVKKEYVALSLTDHPLRDCKWHCIDIIHAPPRRPFGSSTLSVYMDGRLVHATNMKIPPLSEPFSFFRIGAAPYRISKQPDALSHIGPSHGSKAPSSPISPRLPAHELITIQRGSQDHIFGIPVSLKGQLNSICVFHDAILPSETKELFDGGPNIVFRSDDVGDLASKLFLYYNSNGCQGKHCTDLSPQRQNDGTFSGTLSTAWSLANSLTCIGGLSCLLPILEQANAPIRGQNANVDVKSSPVLIHERNGHASRSLDAGNVDSSGGLREDWVIVGRPMLARSESYVEENPVAAFLDLLRRILSRNFELQEDIAQLKTISIIGYLLTKVEPRFLDVNVLFSVQLLIEAAQGSHVWVDFLNDFYQHILFDFRIWIKADFTIRLGHLQYVRKLVKDDRKLFRKKFGVQLFLDALRTHYQRNIDSASEEEVEILRRHTLGIIQEFISQNINHHEVAALITFILSSRCENTINDSLQLILSNLESHVKSDQIYLLLFEPHAADALFCLLLKRQINLEIKSTVVAIFSHLLKSSKVYEKSKVRLRLLDVEMGGVLMLMPGALPPDFAKLYLEQYFSSNLEHPSKYACIIAMFNKLHHAPLSMKLDFAGKFLYAIYMKQGATAQIAVQPGWYHSLVGLLIEAPMTINPVMEKPGSRSISDLIDLKSPEEDVGSMDDLTDANAVMNGASGRRFSDRENSVGSRERLTDADSAVETGYGLSEDSDSLRTRPRRSRTTSDGDSVGPSPSQTNSPSFSRATRSTSQGGLSEVVQDDIVTHDSFTFWDDTMGRGRPESAVDELCSVVLNILSTVLWQGIEGSTPLAWSKRAEVVLSLDMVALSNYLYKKPEELKRRLYEMAIQVVISDLKKDQTKMVNIENAELVIRLVHDFLTAPDLHTNLEAKLTEKLLEDFSALLDAVKVWEAESSEGWSDVLQMSIAVILTVMRCPDLKYCSIVVPKLHYILQCRISCSRREVCYILAALNDTLMMSIDMSNFEHFSFILPVLKLTLEKWATALSTARYLTNIPVLNVSPQNYQTLQKYFRSPEWGMFIGNNVQPLATDYQNSVCKVRKEKMSDFWNEAHDSAMVQLHNRNKAHGESKLRFHQEYLEPARKRIQEDNYRYNCMIQDLKSENVKILRKWEELKRYLFRERGPWQDRHLKEPPLRMSHHENFARMRLKLVENLHFDPHLEAIHLRDNTTPILPVEETLPHISVAKEAKVDELPEDSLIEEEAEPVATGRPPSNEKAELVQREKFVIQEHCDMITITELVQGRFELTTQRIKFHAMNPAYDATTGESYSFEIPFTALREIHLRRYNLRRSALELFLIDQTNYFINFTLTSRNEIYRKIIQLKPTGLVYSKHANPASLFKASGITQRWVNRDISNFEYLMALNTIAGRTYNDLSQYPVFPWVLRDYTSEELEFEASETFRDFSRPMGVQNPKSVLEVQHKFENFEDPSGTIEPFHYGQHYSNPASVIHYLIRVEPFTSLHIQLQGGRFDVADRQFHSIIGTWDLLWSNPNDVKELIPEFYYLPEFLVNMNRFDFGRLQQSKDSVGDVILPKWARTPEEFVYYHRKALESDYVSAHLHEWIDLIFGYKQRGQEAINALNVFYYCTYEGAVDLDAIMDPIERTATEGMINNFGQTPCQLLKESHPRRLTFEEATRKFAAIEGRLLHVFYYTNHLKAFLVEANAEGDPLVFVTIPRIHGRNILQQSFKSDLITIGSSGALGLHIWTPYDRVSPKNMTFERDPTLVNSRYSRNIAGPFHPSLHINSNMFAVTPDCKLLFYGGNWDNSLRVYNFAKGKTTAQVIRHRDLVTCLALDGIGFHLMTGSRDTTCVIWDILQQNNVSYGINGKPLQTLYGHDDEVTCVALSVELDIAVSGSKDATIIVHTVRNGLYVRTLKPGRTIPLNPRNVVNRVALMSDGKIVAGCYFPDCKEAKNSVELYSINGKHLFTEAFPSAVNDLAIVEDYVVTGDAEGRLEIREWFELRLMYSMQVSSAITSVTIPKSCSHVFAGLEDGKLIIITVAPNVLDSFGPASR